MIITKNRAFSKKNQFKIF